MKNIILKLCLLIYLASLIPNYSFSQQNLFNPDNDTVTAKKKFYDRIDDNIKTIDYLKHFLSVQLRTNLITDSAYLTDFYSFLKTQNAILRNPEIVRFGLVDVRLSDTSDAIKYVDIFYDSNLFEYVYPSPYGRLE